MNSEWSLDVLYKGFDDPKYAQDLALLDACIAMVNVFAGKLPEMLPIEVLKTYIDDSERNGERFSPFISSHPGQGPV